jgi:hypothetical protein
MMKRQGYAKIFFEKYPQYDANDLFIILVRVALYESAMANLYDIEEKLK